MNTELITKKYRTRHDYTYFLTAARYFLNYKNAIEEFLTLGDNHEFLNAIEGYSNYAKSIHTVDEMTEEERNKLERKLESFMKEEPLKDFGESFFQLKIFGNISIIHSAMCLEAFINDYCVIKKSNKYFKSNIEKLDLKAKWIVVPKLITNSEIPTEGQSFQYFQKLIKARNSLVHPKTREFFEGTKLDMRPLVEDIIHHRDNVSLSYLAVVSMLSEFKKIDPEFHYLDDYAWIWQKDATLRNLSDIRNHFSVVYSSQNGYEQDQSNTATK